MQWDKEKWNPGMQVRLINNPLWIGMLTGAEPRVRKGHRLFQVRFPDIVERVYEDQLEPQPEERMNPLDLLAEGKLGTPKDLRRTLTHVRLTGRLEEIMHKTGLTENQYSRRLIKLENLGLIARRMRDDEEPSMLFTGVLNRHKGVCQISSPHRVYTSYRQKLSRGVVN